MTERRMMPPAEALSAIDRCRTEIMAPRLAELKKNIGPEISLEEYTEAVSDYIGEAGMCCLELLEETEFERLDPKLRGGIAAYLVSGINRLFDTNFPYRTALAAITSTKRVIYIAIPQSVLGKRILYTVPNSLLYVTAETEKDAEMGRYINLVFLAEPMDVLIYLYRGD